MVWSYLVAVGAFLKGATLGAALVCAAKRRRRSSWEA